MRDLVEGKLKAWMVCVAMTLAVSWPEAMAAGLPCANPCPKDFKDWCQYRGSPDHNNYRKVADKIRVPKVLWKVDKASVPAVSGDDIYAGGSRLRRIETASGEVKLSWQPEGVGPDFQIYGTPVILKDRVIAHASDSRVYALDRALEKCIWAAEVPGISLFSGVCDNELFIISAKNKVVALEVDSGKERWAFALSRLAAVEMTPAVADGKVLFGSGDSRFYALSVDTGEVVWTYEGERVFAWTHPVVSNGKVFVGDRGGFINALSLEKGNLIWEQKSGKTGLSTPGIAPGNIIVGFGKVVILFDEKTGKPDPKGRTFRTASNPFGSPTLVGETLYFGNLDGHLYAFDYKTGQYKWSFEVGEKQQVHDFVYHNDMLIVSTTEGLYALGNDPKKQKLPSKFVLFAE
ncbi:MAG: PQQ-binding-like beta-propeller repeat protein [Planctomycetota bacterium]